MIGNSNSDNDLPNIGGLAALNRAKRAQDNPNKDVATLHSRGTAPEAPEKAEEKPKEEGGGSGDFRIGTVVDGKFRIDALLGAGGMGQVYRANQLSIDEPVAIKFLHAHWAVMGELRARFRREAKALAKLRHPGIVQVIDYGEHQGSLYMAMEMIDGVTLEGIQPAPGETPDVPRIARLFDQILQVLEAAHGQGIVHRDIKPDNVMVLNPGDRTERIKVLDFGIAHMRESEGEKRLTETGTVRGTPMYMSPEQCRGKDVGEKTDVYAVGVMLYELLCGRLPFQGEATADIIAQHIFVEVPEVVDPSGSLPPGLNALIRRAMAKDPRARPTAATLRDELTLVVRGADRLALAQRAAEERLRMANLPREDRAITRRPRPLSTPPENVAKQSDPRTQNKPVLVWSRVEHRGESMRNALSVNGVQVLLHVGAEIPDKPDKPIHALVVVGVEDPVSATAGLRAEKRFSRVPILVADVPGDVQPAALIRAGASDVALVTTGDEEICRKTKRLLRRRR